MKLLVVLTVYKRNNIEDQLKHINNQTIKPDYLVVFQNENHVDISNLKKNYNFIHIKSDYNTKFFGRFASCFTFPVDICMVLDDDIMPGNNCLKNYMEQCIKLNSIIGGNGRIAMNNKNSPHPPVALFDTGIRPDHILVDFVGHLWCFKKEWLHYMFYIKPFTYDTGEDMHLCFSCKILGNIDSYIGKQLKFDDQCDITYNKLAGGIYATCRTVTGLNGPNGLRSNVEKYFIKNYKLQLIKSNK
jgi:hypothetical protein